MEAIRETPSVCPYAFRVLTHAIESTCSLKNLPFLLEVSHIGASRVLLRICQHRFDVHPVSIAPQNLCSAACKRLPAGGKTVGLEDVGRVGEFNVQFVQRHS